MTEGHHSPRGGETIKAEFSELVREYGDPQVASAIYREEASFELMVDMLKKTNALMGEISPEAMRQIRSCNEIFKLFEDKHGKITHLYVCHKNEAAAVLTDRPKFFTEYNLGQKPSLENLLIRIDRLAVEADRLLKSRDLEKCTAMIYSVAKKTLRLLDSSVDCESNGDLKDIVALVENQLQIATEYHKRAARLRAQVNYFLGTIIGVLILILFVIATIIFLPAENVIMGLNKVDFCSVLLCGGIGAVVSVMSRINSKRLILDYEADTRILRLIGSFRPILGGVFAIVLYALFESSLISTSIISPPDISKEKALFYLVVSFLAGFSERLVPDMLDTAGGKFSQPAKEPLGERVEA